MEPPRKYTHLIFHAPCPNKCPLLVQFFSLVGGIPQLLFFLSHESGIPYSLAKTRVCLHKERGKLCRVLQMGREKYSRIMEPQQDFKKETRVIVAGSRCEGGPESVLVGLKNKRYHNKNQNAFPLPCSSVLQWAVPVASANPQKGKWDLKIAGGRNSRPSEKTDKLG